MPTCEDIGLPPEAFYDHWVWMAYVLLGPEEGRRTAEKRRKKGTLITS